MTVSAYCVLANLLPTMTVEDLHELALAVSLAIRRKTEIPRAGNRKVKIIEFPIKSNVG